MQSFYRYCRYTLLATSAFASFHCNSLLASDLNPNTLAQSNVETVRQPLMATIPTIKQGVLKPIDTEKTKDTAPRKALNKQVTWTGTIPHYFYPATGKFTQQYDYLMSGHRYVVGLSSTSLTTAFISPGANLRKPQNVASLVRWNFLNSSKNSVKISRQTVANTQINLTGQNAISHSIKRDSDKHVNVLPALSQVSLNQLYPGINMIMHSKNGTLGYEFYLEPHAKTSNILIQAEGVKALRLNKHGSLIAETAVGAIVHSKPRAFELSQGKKKALPAEFIINQQRKTFGIKVFGRNPNKPLFIDPDITFVSYVGGEGSDSAQPQFSNQLGHFKISLGLDITDEGMILLAGTSASTNMLLREPGEIQGQSDVFAMRFNPDFYRVAPEDRVQYLTFLQGPGKDIGTSIISAPDQKAYLSGYSDKVRISSVQSGIQTLLPGSFVAKLDENGIPEAAKVIGDRQEFYIADLAFENGRNGGLYLAGTAMPIGGTLGAETTTGAFQHKFKGGAHDGFVAKLDADLENYQYFTLLGGNKRDIVTSITVDQGRAFVTGATESANFPVSDFSHQPQISASETQLNACYAGDFYCYDAFVTAISPNGEELLFSTYFGTDHSDYGNDIAISEDQFLAIGGTRLSPQVSRDSEAFVAHFSTGGQLLDQQSFTSGKSSVEAITFNAEGKTYFTGNVSEPGRQTDLLFSHKGGLDLFYSIYDEHLANVELFHYAGGRSWDYGLSIAGYGSEQTGTCLITAGITNSTNISTIGALPEGSNNSGAVDILLAGWCRGELPDLETVDYLVKEGPQSIRPAETGTYSIELLNSNGTVTEEVSIIDSVPRFFQITDVRGPNCNTDVDRNRVECRFDSIQADIGMEIDFQVIENACANSQRSVTNIAQLRSTDRNVASNPWTTTIICPVVCTTGEIPDGLGDCCPDRNDDGVCDLSCPVGQIDSGNGQCCPDADRNGQCDRFCDSGHTSVPGEYCTEDQVCGQFCSMGGEDGLCTLFHCAAPEEVNILHSDWQ